MPHIVVKMYPGVSEENKLKLAKIITEGVMETTGKPELAISVDIVEIKEESWMEDVYNAEIVPNLDRLYKKPGY